MNLKKLGLSDYEGRIYETLLLSGRTDARTVSKNSRVPPTAVYPNLRSLEKKGFIESFSGETFLFEAVAPRKAFAAYEEKKIRELAAAKEEAIRLLENHSPLQKQFDPIKLSYGKAASYNIFLELSKKVSKRMFVAGWKFRHANDVQTLIKNVKSMRSRGVDVRILFAERSEITDFISSQIISIGACVRYFDAGNFSLMVADDAVCKISLKSEDRKERVSITIEDKDLSKAMLEYFNALWKKAGPNA